MKTAAVIVAAIAVMALSTPALTNSKKHRHGFAQAPEGVARISGEPQFIRVGPNGYWVTTTWGCWIDDGQGRIQDCSSAGAGVR